MRLQIDFFRHTEEEPGWIIVRRKSGQFASQRDAEIYGLTKRPEAADGFRILRGGVIQKTVSIRTEKQGNTPPPKGEKRDTPTSPLP